MAGVSTILKVNLGRLTVSIKRRDEGSSEQN